MSEPVRWVLLVCPPDDDPGQDWRGVRPLGTWRAEIAGIEVLNPEVVPAKGVSAKLPMLFRYMPSPEFFDWLATRASYDPASGLYRDAPT